MEEILIRYLHFVGIIFFSGTLIFEHLTIKKSMTNENFKRLCYIDRFYGISAIVVFTAGMFLWFSVGKDASFYTSNPLFHIKLTIFVIIGLLSIYPTIFFIKNRKIKDEIVLIPKKVIVYINIQMILFILLPLLASLIAQGYGLGD